MIIAGKTYRDQHNGRRYVVSIEDGIITFQFPISLESQVVTLAEFEAWSVGEYVDPFA